MVAIFLARSAVPSPVSSLWQQGRVEFLERTRFDGSDCGGTLKQVLQIVIAVSVESANRDLFFGFLQLPFHRTMRLQQVAQPGGPGSFFKGDLQLSTQPVDKVQKDVRFGLDHAFPDDLSSSIPDRNRNTLLVHIHADIFSASHIRVFLSGGVRAEHSNPYSQRGTLLYCVA